MVARDEHELCLGVCVNIVQRRTNTSSSDINSGAMLMMMVAKRHKKHVRSDFSTYTRKIHLFDKLNYSMNYDIMNNGPPDIITKRYTEDRIIFGMPGERANMHTRRR